MINLKKYVDFDQSAENLHLILTNYSILDASKYFQQNLTKSQKISEAFMNGKSENVIIVFFVNFELFVGISVVLPLNFTNILATTDTTTYFKIFQNIFKNT